MNRSWCCYLPLAFCAAVALASSSLSDGAEVAASRRTALTAGIAARGDGAAGIFDHRLHVEEEGLDCSMCHLGAEDEERAGMPVLNACRLCHEPPEPGEGGGEPTADPLLPLFDAEGQYAGEIFSTLPPETLFSHLGHVTAGVDCAECHGDMSINSSVDRSVAPSMGDCISCHMDRGQPAACSTCHVDGSRALYGLHCEVCHGPDGRGDGPAAPLLSPAPRDFGSGRFRLISTRNGAPTLDDLVATIRRGMPGSAMPPSDGLAEEDLSGLARHVRQLAIDGQVAGLLAWAEEEEEELSEAEAQEIALRRMTPGEPIDVGLPAPPDPLVLDEGRRLYRMDCAPCHGEDGTGSGAVSRDEGLFNEDGTPSFARDFTAGIFKGGSQHADLARRILGGLPGSPMPATSLKDPRQVSALVAYVQSMVKPGAEERVRQRRRTVTVARAVGALPSDPGDATWSEVEDVRIALAPLWWRDERIEDVELRALHDGETIAIRMAWLDASRDDEPPGERTFSDAAAIEISSERDPPLFGLGVTGRPVEVALWRAAPGKDAPEEALPGSADVSRTDREGAAKAPWTHAFGSQDREPGEALWETCGARIDGSWVVVFSRAMSTETETETETEGGPALPPGLSASLAIAVWDGASGDRGGRKSFSVWQRLELAP